MVPVEPAAFHASPARARPVFVLGLLVTAAGLWLLIAGEPWSVGAAATGFGAVLAGFLGQPAWRRIRMLWIGPAGLGARIHGFGVVPWHDIEATWAGRTGERIFLFVDRTAAARAAAPVGVVLRALATVAKAPDLAVPIDLLDSPPERIAAAVEIAWRAARSGEPG